MWWKINGLLHHHQFEWNQRRLIIYILSISYILQYKSISIQNSFLPWNANRMWTHIEYQAYWLKYSRRSMYANSIHKLVNSFRCSIIFLLRNFPLQQATRLNPPQHQPTHSCVTICQVRIRHIRIRSYIKQGANAWFIKIFTLSINFTILTMFDIMHYCNYDTPLTNMLTQLQFIWSDWAENQKCACKYASM